LFKIKNKGAIEVSLHWIFVMIVGAIILIFFVTIVAKQKSNSDINLLLDLKSTMESYVVGSKSISGAGLVLPDSGTLGNNVDFSCEKFGNVCSCGFTLGNKVSLDLETNVVFSPRNLGNDKLIVSSLSWNFPYSVTNFIYFTSPQERYIFAHDFPSENFAKDIFHNKLSSNLQKELISIGELGEIEDLGFSKRKIIIFGLLPGGKFPDLPEFANNENTRIIHIPLTTGESNPVSFHYFSPLHSRFLAEPDSTYTYLGIPNLVGSFYVDTDEDFFCMRQNAFSNLKNVNDVYYERVKLLDKSQVCSSFYKQSHKSPFENIADLSSTLLQEEAPPKDTYAQLISVTNTLKNANERIENEACPLLY
jgi:hypothetical protein